MPGIFLYHSSCACLKSGSVAEPEVSVSTLAGHRDLRIRLQCKSDRPTQPWLGIETQVPMPAEQAF